MGGRVGGWVGANGLVIPARPQCPCLTHLTGVAGPNRTHATSITQSIRQLNALAAGLPLGGGGAAGGAGGGSGAGGGAAGGRAGGGGGGGGGPTTESHTGHPTRPGQPLKLSGAPQPPELVVRPEEEWDVVPAVVVTAAPAAAVAAVAVEATGVLGAAVQPHAAAGAQQQQQQRGPRGCRGSWR